ncbi:SLATT domain-containing protein [Prosthecobacter sp. SYSU 5D2]|uniref:SLATT domain-containing protein n=1 Tax=Prosthecobacter sp. SYSU 5D2 TaxID=3134134 RepID=UPI0031FEF4B1
MSEEPKSKKVPLYAQGSYDRELNYKLWSTYKSRFNAAARCQKKYNLSSRAVSFLSAYVIIFSLITTMLPQFSQGATEQVILFISSALSIIILVVSQLESSQNYSVRTYTFHQSGLAIAELYKKLRALKSRHKDKSSPIFLDAVELLSDQYDEILRRSDNHEDIDFESFKASKPSYEDHNLTIVNVLQIKARLILCHYSYYYLCMGLPPVAFAVFAWLTWPQSIPLASN